MPIIRDHVNGVLDIIDVILAAAEGGMEQTTSFQSLFANQVMSAFQSLSKCKEQLEQVVHDSTKHDGKPSAKMFAQSLPPIVFQTAREAKELTARAEAVLLDGQSGIGEDFR